MTEADLKKLSKIELEKLGREKGVELDRRLTKSKLVAQIANLFSSSPSKSKSVIRKEILADHPNWNERLIQLELTKRLKEENK